MRKLSYNQNRLLAGILGVLILFAAANYYLDLALFGLGKGFMLLILGVVIVWGTFFAPTRQEIREHRNQHRRSPP